MSRTMMSTLARCTPATASWPLPTEWTTAMSGSLSSVRESTPRMTAESSTTITRMRSPASAFGRSEVALGSTMLDESDLRELGLDDVAVERLHDVLVRTGIHGFHDVRHVVLGRAEHHDRVAAVVHRAQLA